jgi:signal transduction histidine kinase
VVGAGGASRVSADAGFRWAVREALTNAAKHAPGEPVAIEIDVESHRFAVHVSNLATNPPRTGGSGLVGLRERLRLLGGRLDSTFDHGRFELVAEVPVA